MRTIIVDDDPVALEMLTAFCEQNKSVDIMGKFTSVQEALSHARAEHEAPELALLDIEMPVMNGLELAEQLRRLRRDMVIVFVTAHDKYTAEAMRQKADFVLLKPYSQQDVNDVVERAGLLAKRFKKRVRCQCFGNFTLFVDDVPVYFNNSKAEELLAVCVYRRGALVRVEEIIDKLWEDYTGAPRNCSKYRMAVKALMDALKEHHVEYIFGRKTGVCYVNCDAFDCDYYSFLEGNPAAVKAFCGEFMENYRWAEGVAYMLQNKQ